jgi:hypothetical protein
MNPSGALGFDRNKPFFCRTLIAINKPFPYDPDLCHRSLILLIPDLEFVCPGQPHIRQLMNMMGSGQLGVQIIKNMMATYKKSMPDVDPKNDPDAPAHHPGIHAGRRGMGETAEREDHATPQGKGLSQKFLIMPS